MKKNLKSEKGAITLVVLIGMLFLTAFLMSVYIGIANRAQSSAETTQQISEKYNNLDKANAIYDNYFADTNVIPITTKEQLEKIASGEQVLINNKVYTFSADGYYTIQNDLDLGGVYNESTGTWSGTQWTPLTSEFTGILDGLGHTITGLYINNTQNNQGLFGTLKGTVKNLSIEESHITANMYIGSIAGINNGTIQNCHNEAIILGNSVMGGMAGQNNGTINVEYVENLLCYHEDLLNSSDVLEINTKYLDNNKKTVVIPKGFNILKSEATNVEEGIVIQDENGNEFVWVPVEVTSTDTKTSIASFYRSLWADNDRSTSLMNSSSYIEPYTGNTWEVEEYNAMVESVYNNHGFYIGRYEAGSNNNRYETREDETVLVKKGAIPYNYVGWGASMINYVDELTYNSTNYGHGAVYLSKNMYTGNEYGVISTLCYGVQWDAVLRFVKDEEHDVTNSTTWGNYYKHEFTFTGKFSSDYGEIWTEEVTNETKPEDDSWLLTTGASEDNKAKNIYDLAGNVLEWTMEVYSTDYRVCRGGIYFWSGGSYPASRRGGYYPNYCLYSYGFRPTLYIK